MTNLKERSIEARAAYFEGYNNAIAAAAAAANSFGADDSVLDAITRRFLKTPDQETLNEIVAVRDAKAEIERLRAIERLSADTIKQQMAAQAANLAEIERLRRERDDLRQLLQRLGYCAPEYHVPAQTENKP